MSTNGDDLVRQVRGALAGERAQQVIGTAQRIRTTTGTPVLAGYLFWILGTMVLSAGEFHYPLLERSISFTGFEFIGFSGLLQLLVLLSFLSVLLPYWWKSRAAWLGYAVPAVLLVFVAPVIVGSSAGTLEEYIAAEFSPTPGFFAFEPDSADAGFGLYIAAGAAFYLAFVGVKNWIKRLPLYSLA